jgi:hypothetical protein
VAKIHCPVEGRGLFGGTILEAVEPCGGTGREKPLGSTFLFFLGLPANPRVSLVCHLCKQQEVIAAEAVGRFPILPVPVETREGGIETRATVGFVFP